MSQKPLPNYAKLWQLIRSGKTVDVIFYVGKSKKKGYARALLGMVEILTLNHSYIQAMTEDVFCDLCIMYRVCF